jgi:hypothetical protein
MARTKRKRNPYEPKEIKNGVNYLYIHGGEREWVVDPGWVFSSISSFQQSSCIGAA